MVYLKCGLSEVTASFKADFMVINLILNNVLFRIQRYLWTGVAGVYLRCNLTLQVVRQTDGRECRYCQKNFINGTFAKFR